MSLRCDFDDDYCNAEGEENSMNMEKVYEELEKRQKLKRLYICEINREKLYGLYAAVCLELRLAHSSLKYREKHQSSESIDDFFRTLDAAHRVGTITWIYNRLKFALPHSVWFAFKRRYKRDRKKGWKSL